MQAMTTNMVGLKQAAESGSFAISQDGAQAYIKAIEDAQMQLAEVDLDILDLVNKPKLGTSPDGKSLSEYNLENVNGGAGTTGIIKAIDDLKAALEEARLAMQKAVENYREIDGSAAGTYQRY